MSQQSLAEALFQRKWYNPFPKYKFTERPDTACACLMEGKVIILTDTSPSALVLPTSIFDMIEEANDYYFPPITGIYLKNFPCADHTADSLHGSALSALYAEPGMDPGHLPLCTGRRYRQHPPDLPDPDSGACHRRTPPRRPQHSEYAQHPSQRHRRYRHG